MREERGESASIARRRRVFALPRGDGGGELRSGARGGGGGRGDGGTRGDGGLIVGGRRAGDAPHDAPRDERAGRLRLLRTRRVEYS